jgi:hypothetical protein
VISTTLIDVFRQKKVFVAFGEAPKFVERNP